MIRLAKLWLMAGLLAFGLAMPAAAQLQVRVDEGNFQPTPLAIPDFEVRGANAEMEGSWKVPMWHRQQIHADDGARRRSE